MNSFSSTKFYYRFLIWHKCKEKIEVYLATDEGGKEYSKIKMDSERYREMFSLEIDMKIIYEIDPDPERDGRSVAEQMHKSLDMALALWDFDSELRRMIKHGENQNTTWDEVRTLFNGILEQRDLNLGLLCE